MPDRQLDRPQAHCFSVEIANRAEIRSGLQLSIERVGPAVIWTGQLCRRACRLRHNGCRMMAAYIEESVKNIICVAHDHNRLARDLARDVLAGRFDLFHSADELPGMRKDCPSLEFG